MKSKILILIETILILVMLIYIMQYRSNHSAWEMNVVQATARQAADAFSETLSSNDEIIHNDAICRYLAAYYAVCSISERRGNAIQYSDLMNNVYGYLLSNRPLSNNVKTEIISVFSAIEDDYSNHTLISGIFREIINELDDST